MTNAVENLFNSVLQGLPVDVSSNVPDWSNSDWFQTTTEIPVDELFGSDDDDLLTMEADSDFRKDLDRSASQRVTVPLIPEDVEVIEGGIRHRGFETLAFYKSRRNISQRPFPEKWGIFYLKQGLLYIENTIENEYPGYGDPRKLAHEFLRVHEWFHYRADIQMLMFEAALARHLHLPLQRALGHRKSHFVEEALANRQVWDWSKSASVGISEFAYEFMKLQPNAYARFDEPRLELAAEWAGNAVSQLPPGNSGRADLAPWVEASPTCLLRYSLCPEYVVYPSRLSSWISPTLVPPPVRRVNDGSEVAKALNSRFAHLNAQWEKTKTKLLENRLLRGLNFKPWPKGGPTCYSVRVDDNFRAHLRHDGGGAWTSYEFGPHTKLGHG